MIPWYKSKQFWFNVLTLVIAVATAFGFESFTPDARIVVIAPLIIAAINVLLRFVLPTPPPPAHLERTKSGVCDFQPPHATYRRTNATAGITVATLGLAIAAALAIVT